MAQISMPGQQKDPLETIMNLAKIYQAGASAAGGKGDATTGPKLTNEEATTDQPDGALNSNSASNHFHGQDENDTAVTDANKEDTVKAGTPDSTSNTQQTQDKAIGLAGNIPGPIGWIAKGIEAAKALTPKVDEKPVESDSGAMSRRLAAQADDHGTTLHNGMMAATDLPDGVRQQVSPYLAKAYMKHYTGWDAPDEEGMA